MYLYDENDRVGISLYATQSYEAFLTSCNMEVVQQGSNNIPFYSPYTKQTEFIEVYTKLLNLFSTDNSYLNIANGFVVDMFTGSKTLFMSNTLTTCPIIRKQSDINFGIMPLPKLNADQEKYMHISPNGDALFIIDGASDELEFAGAILEAAAYYSSSYYSDNALMPSYFSLCLATKNAPDLESSENLQLIHDNICYTTKVLGTEYMNSIYANLSSKNYSIASVIQQNNKKLVKKIPEVMATIGIEVKD